MYRSRLLPLLLAGLAVTGAASAAPAPQIKWGRSLSTATTKARTTRQLVMVDLYTDWCTWCKRLDKDTFRDKQVVALVKKLVPVKLNAEKEGAITAKLYRVDSYPTILFLDRFGKVVSRLDGYLGPKEFAAYLRKVYAKQARAEKASRK